MTQWLSARGARHGRIAAQAADRLAPADAAEAPYVQLRRLSKTYGSGHGAKRALAELDVELSAGEFVAFTGPARSGKTTLIDLISARESPTAGEIIVGGRRVDLLDERSRLEFRTADVGLAPQTPTLAPTLTAYETVWQAAHLGGIAQPDRWARLLLRTVGFREHAERLAVELSLEDQQRLSIARALAKDAPLLLVDEPLSGASDEARQLVVSALRRASIERATTVLLATREPRLAACANRLICLQRRRR
jgi:putative ABC transport system ATP-binding protein